MIENTRSKPFLIDMHTALLFAPFWPVSSRRSTVNRVSFHPCQNGLAARKSFLAFSRRALDADWPLRYCPRLKFKGRSLPAGEVRWIRNPYWITPRSTMPRSWMCALSTFRASGITSVFQSISSQLLGLKMASEWMADSIRGWASIHESDMLLIPDANSVFMDPFRDTPTLVMLADVVDPMTKQPYPRDSRHIARKAEAYLGFAGRIETQVRRFGQTQGTSRTGNTFTPTADSSHVRVPA